MALGKLHGPWQAAWDDLGPYPLVDRHQRTGTGYAVRRWRSGGSTMAGSSSGPMMPALTNRIAVPRDGLALDEHAHASWTDRATAMIQIRVARSFQASGKIANVPTDRDRPRSDYHLRSSLIAFQVQPGGDRTVIRVALDSSLRRLASGRQGGPCTGHGPTSASWRCCTAVLVLP